MDTKIDFNRWTCSGNAHLIFLLIELSYLKDQQFYVHKMIYSQRKCHNYILMPWDHKTYYQGFSQEFIELGCCDVTNLT